MKKINSFVVTKITKLTDDEINLHTLIDAKSYSFIVGFHKNNDGEPLGFIFKSDLEMLCRANELVFVRSLMYFLKDYYNGQEFTFPFSVYVESKELQAA